MTNEGYKVVGSNGRLKTMQEYTICNNNDNNNTHYQGNKELGSIDSMTEGKNKRGEESKKSYIRPTIGKCFKCNLPRHKSFECQEAYGANDLISLKDYRTNYIIDDKMFSVIIDKNIV